MRKFENHLHGPPPSEPLLDVSHMACATWRPIWRPLGLSTPVAGRLLFWAKAMTHQAKQKAPNLNLKDWAFPQSRGLDRWCSTERKWLVKHARYKWDRVWLLLISSWERSHFSTLEKYILVVHHQFFWNKHWALPLRSNSLDHQLQNKIKCAFCGPPFWFIYMRVELWAKPHGIKLRCY